MSINELLGLPSWLPPYSLGPLGGAALVFFVDFVVVALLWWRPERLLRRRHFLLVVVGDVVGLPALVAGSGYAIETLRHTPGFYTGSYWLVGVLATAMMYGAFYPIWELALQRLFTVDQYRLPSKIWHQGVWPLVCFAVVYPIPAMLATVKDPGLFLFEVVGLAATVYSMIRSGPKPSPGAPEAIYAVVLLGLLGFTSQDLGVRLPAVVAAMGAYTWLVCLIGDSRRPNLCTDQPVWDSIRRRARSPRSRRDRHAGDL